MRTVFIVALCVLVTAALIWLLRPKYEHGKWHERPSRHYNPAEDED